MRYRSTIELCEVDLGGLKWNEVKGLDLVTYRILLFILVLGNTANRTCFKIFWQNHSLRLLTIPEGTF